MGIHGWIHRVRGRAGLATTLTAALMASMLAGCASGGANNDPPPSPPVVPDPSPPPVVVEPSATHPWLPGDLIVPVDTVERPAASVDLELASTPDLDDPLAVFAAVFAALPRSVDVRPTENYLYWRFRTPQAWVWGNLRVGTRKSELGTLHIGYYEYSDTMTGPEQANVRYRTLGVEDGLKALRRGPFLFDLAYGDRVVSLQLNNLAQSPPTRFKLGKDERFVFNTEDESGVRFHLLFDDKNHNFMFVANEETSPLDGMISVGERLVLDSRTGFAFYRDPRHNGRHVLIGVFRPNVARNTYYDGPADQLAENQIPEVPGYRENLHKAYPFTRGVIDDYGFYLKEAGNRIAVAPYYAYTGVEELAGMIEVCDRANRTVDVLACLIPEGLHRQARLEPGETEDIYAGSEGGQWNEGEDGLPWLDNSVAIEARPGLPAGDVMASIHAGTISWHLAGITAIPDGSKHAAAITWHLRNLSFIPAGSIHEAGNTWHRQAQTFIPPGSIHAAAITWHLPGITFIPAGSIHAAGITWHIAGQTFVPRGSRHAAGITWHIPGVTFVPRGSPHAAAITWHIAGRTFVPAGGTHAAGFTWHIPGSTFIPPGGRHAAGITWHIPGTTFIPPGSRHAAGITWHMPGITFIPPGSKHAAGITWHIPGTTFIPPGAKHAAGITWHIPGITFIPPGARHVAGVTWHQPGLTFVPPGARHAAGITWHIPGTTFIPPGGKHAAAITWHIRGASFIPPGAKHMAGVTWHRAGVTFVPAGSTHVAGTTWHMPGMSFVPPGSIHNTGATWHYRDRTFIPPGTIHNTGSTWHYEGQTFIPPGTRHNSGVTWHAPDASFIPP